jgi:outer membrane biosynthesis protein TonB
MNVEEIAQQAADRVRELIAEAERRAAEIVGEAEDQATRIRARAEADARKRLDDVRGALASLESSLGSNASAEVEPGPVVVPEPTPPATPEPQPPPTPEPTPPVVPEPEPPPDEGTPPSPEPPANGPGDEAAARLVAMKMALDGASREDVERHLADSYGLADRARLLDDVFSRVPG